MHIAEVVTIAKSLPLLRLNTYKSLILSYSADYRRIFGKNSLLVYFFCNQIIILCVKLTSPLDINWYVKSLVILVLAGLILPILVFVSNTFLPWMSGKFNYLSSYCLK